ncbi:MAG: helix-turn-helix domain-containing protein, partial [Candidatus Spyradenecus sp.]
LWKGVSYGPVKSLGSQIREARQQRHLSQSALARKVGCKQSALSMFEGGRQTALNAQIIGKLCAELGLLPPNAQELAAAQGVNERSEQLRSYCPNPECPSNLPITVGARHLLVPRGHLLSEGECHCAWCGEVLERACPECGAPVNEGAFCSHCGTAYLVSEDAHSPKRAEVSEQLMAWSRV